MAFLDIFRRNKSVVNNSTTAAEASEQHQPIINRDLFVEDNEPELKDQPKKVSNPIEAFLDQNFEWQGYNDGYAHPEAEYLHNKLSLLHAEFRLAIDKGLDFRRMEVGDLNLHLIKTSGISKRMEAQLQEKIKQHETIIHELDVQKIISLESDGMIAPAIHAYRLGFIKGLEKYQQEKLFAGSTGLFNN